MNYDIETLIKLRLEKAKETLEVAQLLLKKHYWNSAANRLYYSAFYAVLALLAKMKVKSTTHSGAKSEFFRLFIKTGIFERKYGELFTDLFNKRQEGDYDDFTNFSGDEIKPLFEKV